MSKKTKIGLTLIISCPLGLYTAFISSSINRYLDFAISTTIYMYLFYISLFGYIKRVEQIIPKNYRKIVSFKVFKFWLAFWFAWFIVGALFISKVNSLLFVNFWVFSIFAIIIIYSCVCSLAVYIPLFQYLDSPKNERENRKSLANDLVVLTIGLGSPWLLLILIVILVTFPSWVNYFIGIIIVYIPTFFIAIDYPYYRGVEKEKEMKISALKLDKKVLLEKLGKLRKGELYETGLSDRIVIELNLERIDRDISEVKSVSSHPYSVIKPIVGFIIVNILATIFVEVILKFALHI